MVTIEVGIGLPLLWDFGATISRPQRLRAIIGSLGGGGFPVTVAWDAPESWGDDQFDQVQTRRAFQGSYRQLTNADGTPHTGTYSVPTAFNQFDDDLDHRLPVAPNGSTWEFQVRAINRSDERSGYSHLTIHPTSGLFGFRFGQRFD